MTKFHQIKRKLLVLPIVIFGACALQACDDEPDTLSEQIEEMGDDIEKGAEELEHELDEAADEAEKSN